MIDFNIKYITYFTRDLYKQITCNMHIKDTAVTSLLCIKNNSGNICVSRSKFSNRQAFILH